MFDIVAGKKFEKDHGGAIYCHTSNIIAYAHLSFTKNTAYDSGGALFVVFGVFTIQGTTMSLYDGNSANGFGGGAIMTTHAILEVCGNITFVNNTSPDGGAMSLYFDVHFWFKKDQRNPICLYNNFISFH